MSTDQKVERAAEPLLNNDNAFKLGVFGANVSSGCAMTSAEGTIQVDWEESVNIARAADEAGLDAMVPVARWKGSAGQTNFNDRSFETFTWAAGLAALTKRIQILATVHVPTAHPVRIAKEAATVDHISGGRLGLNIVAGWNEPEFAMFGLEQKEHDDRYDVADEWIDLATQMWQSAEPFDYRGSFFSGTGVWTNPKPVQTPRPLIMSAGASGRGGEFAARNADINFIQAPDLDTHLAKGNHVRELAKTKYDRDIKIMGMGYVVCADTEAEARKYFDYYVNEKGDWDGAAKMLGLAQVNIQSMDFSAKQTMVNMIAGYTGQPLIGTPEQIVEGLLAFQKVGLDGATLSWVNYSEGIAQYREQILPLAIEAGLRCPVD